MRRQSDLEQAINSFKSANGTMSGILTRLGISNDQRILPGTLLIFEITDLVKKHFRLRGLEDDVQSDFHKQALAVILTSAHAYDRPERARTNEIARNLSSLLHHLQWEMMLPPFDEECGIPQENEEKEDTRSFERSMRNIDDALYAYIKARLKDVRSLLQDRPTKTKEKNKHRDQSMRHVLRRLESFINSFVQSLRVPQERIRDMNFVIEQIQQACEKVGKTFSRDYVSSISLLKSSNNSQMQSAPDVSDEVIRE